MTSEQTTGDSPVPIVRTVAQLRRAVRNWRVSGESVALAPTMGALHHGHLSLVHASREKAQRVVASIFVNPTQFGPGVDHDAYPQNEARDVAVLAEAGCDLVYAPSVEEMYHEDFSTHVAVRGVSEVLCGAQRPGFLDGMATMVMKLLIQTLPDLAVFGEKDWQALVVIRRMVRDLDIPVRILAAPTVREEDGLAMSLRNDRLSEEQRRIAPKLHKVLTYAGQLIARGAPVERVLEASSKALEEAGFDSVDYFEMRDPDDLGKVTSYDGVLPARLFAAAHLGGVRLLDNTPVPEVARGG